MSEGGLSDPRNVFQQQVAAARRQTTAISMTWSFPLMTRAILSWIAWMGRSAFIRIVGSGGSEKDADRTPLESSKGSGAGQFIRGFPRHDPSKVGRVWLEHGSCWRPFGDKRDHPRGRFFYHVMEAPGRAAGRHVWKRRASANGDREEAVGGLVRGALGRECAGNPSAKIRRVRDQCSPRSRAPSTAERPLQRSSGDCLT